MEFKSRWSPVKPFEQTQIEEMKNSISKGTFMHYSKDLGNLKSYLDEIGGFTFKNGALGLVVSYEDTEDFDHINITGLYTPITAQYHALNKPVTIDRGHNDQFYDRNDARKQAGLRTSDYPKGPESDLPQKELAPVKRTSSRPIEPMEPQKKDDVPPGRFFNPTNKSDEKKEEPAPSANTSKNFNSS